MKQSKSKNRNGTLYSQKIVYWHILMAKHTQHPMAIISAHNILPYVITIEKKSIFQNQENSWNIHFTAISSRF